MEEEKLLNLLSDLHAFNLLTEKIVELIGLNFDVNVKEICKQNGITYET